MKLSRLSRGSLTAGVIVAALMLVHFIPTWLFIAAIAAVLYLVLTKKDNQNADK